MGLNKKSVDDINVKGLRVLCRCDFNVPLKEGKITDENRLVAALPTIKKLVADGGKVILCSHLGKPKGEPKPELSLAPVAARLTELLGQEVKFAADNEVVGPNAKAAVEAMKDGDIILLENTRYRAEETKNGEAFSKDLASLCDVFVNDAFGTAHRAHCSNVGVAELVDTAVVGYLMQKEIDFLGNAVENPVRPFVAILGGAKVADKLNVISNLLEKCDTLIIGGGMAYTFLKAQGKEIGKSLVDDSKLDYCKEMMDKAKSLGKELLLPVDTTIAASFPDPIDGPIEVSNVSADAIPADIVISTNGGYPLDQNIYQSVKGMTAAEATVKEGGVIIMLSKAADGHGGKYFHETFRDEKDLNRMMKTFLDRKPEETIIDQWQSQIFARLLLKATVVFVSSCDDQLVEDLHMVPAHSMEEALEKAKAIVKKDDYKVTVIPDGVSVIVRE